MAGKSAKKPVTFEAGLEMLEKIAQQMEDATLPLDELLKLYEEGLSLSQELEKRLNDARGRMMEIRKGADGKPEAVESSVEQQMTLLPAEEEN
ncbi:MAG: exodeoxyribonuclease VII small subunit [Clostridia bacterium]|nr:exodeoxyribonuclease VII small subunit [Clostridia bacterium]